MAHKPLNAINGVKWVSDGLTLSNLPYQTLSGFRDSDDRRRGTTTFGVFNNLRFTGFNKSDGRVCGSEIDSNYFCHICLEISRLESSK